MYPPRTYCDTLYEMRSILERVNILNYKKSIEIMRVLVEECQTYGNRMEAGLTYTRDINRLHKKRKKLQEEIKAIKKQLPKQEEKEPLQEDMARISRILRDEEDDNYDGDDQ